MIIFLDVWKYLGLLQKEKILNIIADGKGIIPYEKLLDEDSMSFNPENDIFLEK